MTEPEAPKYICITCGYTANKEWMVEEHEAGERAVTDDRDHIMDIHPEHQ